MIFITLLIGRFSIKINLFLIPIITRAFYNHYECLIYSFAIFFLDGYRVFFDRKTNGDLILEIGVGFEIGTIQSCR